MRPGSTSRRVSIASSSASGLGDLAVFGKYRLLRQQDGGLAAAIEVRLPTGDKEALRGLDVTRTLTSLIWSRGGRISPHANVGYEFWSDAVPISATGDVFAQHSVKYAAGVEIEAGPRATVVIDLLGRQVRHGGKVGYQTFAASGGSIRRPGRSSRRHPSAVAGARCQVERLAQHPADRQRADRAVQRRPQGERRAGRRHRLGVLGRHARALERHRGTNPLAGVRRWR